MKDSMPIGKRTSPVDPLDIRNSPILVALERWTQVLARVMLLLLVLYRLLSGEALDQLFTDLALLVPCTVDLRVVLPGICEVFK